MDYIRHAKSKLDSDEGFTRLSSDASRRNGSTGHRNRTYVYVEYTGDQDANVSRTNVVCDPGSAVGLATAQRTLMSLTNQFGSETSGQLSFSVTGFAFPMFVRTVTRRHLERIDLGGNSRGKPSNKEIWSMTNTSRVSYLLSAIVVLSGLALAPAAFAQDKMTKDSMSHDTMSKDAMKKDDAMSHDAMKKDDAMAKDSMAKDAMKKDEMKK